MMHKPLGPPRLVKKPVPMPAPKGRAVPKPKKPPTPPKPKKEPHPEMLFEFTPGRCGVCDVESGLLSFCAEHWRMVPLKIKKRFENLRREARLAVKTKLGHFAVRNASDPVDEAREDRVG